MFIFDKTLKMKLDDINWKILEILQTNARLSNSEIARTIGITSPAIAERIKKMEDSGVIMSYRTKVSHFETGYQLKAIITLHVFMGRLKPFIEKVKEFKEVINCYRITGDENIIMEVILKDQKHLEKFIDILINYGETKTHIVLSQIIDNKPIKSNTI